MIYEINNLQAKFLARLQQMREFEWNNYDVKFWGEFDDQPGVRSNENSLQAIARHMAEVANEHLVSIAQGEYHG